MRESAGWQVSIIFRRDVGLVRNLETFAGMWWLTSGQGTPTDGRPHLEKVAGAEVHAAFIDHGYCFNAGSGPFRIIHCAVYARTKCMRAAGDGVV